MRTITKYPIVLFLLITGSFILRIILVTYFVNDQYAIKDIRSQIVVSAFSMTIIYTFYALLFKAIFNKHHEFNLETLAVLAFIIHTLVVCLFCMLTVGLSVVTVLRVSITTGVMSFAIPYLDNYINNLL